MKLQVKCNLNKSYCVKFQTLTARKHSCAVKRRDNFIFLRLHCDVTCSIPDCVTLRNVQHLPKKSLMPKRLMKKWTFMVQCTHDEEVDHEIFRPRLCKENLYPVEGLLTHPSYPERANFAYTSLQNVETKR